MSKKFLDKKSIVSLALVSGILAFFGIEDVSAGMYIVNDTQVKKVNPENRQENINNGLRMKFGGIDSGDSPVFRSSSDGYEEGRDSLNIERKYKIISNRSDSSYVSARPVIVGPVGYGERIPVEVFLSQVAPEGWKLSCSSIICDGKVVSWHSDGRVRWMDLFYDVVSPNDEFDVSFDEFGKVAYIKYIKGSAINWKVDGKKTLRENIKLWSETAGWDMKWNTLSDADWEIGNSFVLKGNYEEVLESLLGAFREQGIVLSANKYKNGVIEIKQHYSEYGL